MDENRFWTLIEAAWGAAGGKSKSRQRLAEGKLSEGQAYALQEVLEEEVAPALREQLDTLSADELLAFAPSGYPGNRGAVVSDRQRFDGIRATISAARDSMGQAVSAIGPTSPTTTAG